MSIIPSERIRTPLQERSRQSFERVLDAATELLVQDGYDAVTLARVSERAGVSTGSIYGRIKGKDDLLSAVQSRILERVEAGQEHMLSGLKAEVLPLNTLVPSLMDAFGEFMRQHAELLRPLMAQAASDPGVAQRGKTSFQKLQSALTGLLLSRRDEIAHPDPEHAADACFRLAYAAFARYLGLGSSPDAAGEGDWDSLKRDLGEMSLAYLCWSADSQH